MTQGLSWANVTTHVQVFTRAAFDRASEITNKVSNAISLVSSAASLMSTAVVSTSSSAEADTPSANSSGRKSRFGKWGALALGAGVLAAGAALVSNKDAVGKGAEWMKSHLEFVQVLWNEEEMKQRWANQRHELVYDGLLHHGSRLLTVHLQSRDIGQGTRDYVSLLLHAGMSISVYRKDVAI